MTNSERAEKINEICKYAIEWRRTDNLSSDAKEAPQIKLFRMIGELLDEALREAEKKGFDNAEFWKDIILDDEKTPSQHIKDELHDYKIMLKNVPIVYDNVTGGLLSKPLYEAEVVVDAFNDHVTRERDEAFDEGFAAAREKAAGIAENYSGLDRQRQIPGVVAERIRAMEADK